ncbi:MAG: DUF1772 domain-containing protein [Nakamurella sp.]
MPSALMFLTAAAAYAGFQLTVHVLVYRQFSAVPAAAFAGYERLHQRRISFVVGPLFAALLGTAGWLAIDRPAAIPVWLGLLPAVLVAAVLGSTALLAVPLHRRLSAGWDASVYRSLLRVDLFRTLIAGVTVVVGLTLAVLVES